MSEDKIDVGSIADLSPAQSVEQPDLTESDDLVAAKWYTISFLIVASILSLASLVLFIWIAMRFLEA